MENLGFIRFGKDERHEITIEAYSGALEGIATLDKLGLSPNTFIFPMPSKIQGHDGLRENVTKAALAYAKSVEVPKMFKGLVMEKKGDVISFGYRSDLVHHLPKRGLK